MPSPGRRVIRERAAVDRDDGERHVVELGHPHATAERPATAAVAEVRGRLRRAYGLSLRQTRETIAELAFTVLRD